MTDSEVEIELAKIRSDVATLAVEVVRLREALQMNSRGSLAMLEALGIVKAQVDRLGHNLIALESWVGVPDVQQ